MDVLDFINRNGQRTVPNPNYNPNSKKNTEPSTLIVPDTQPFPDEVLEMAKQDAINKFSVDSNITDKYREFGLNYNPKENLDKQLADAQSNWAKVFNSIGQALVSETLLGIPKGIADFIDLVTSKVFRITNDTYHNPISDFLGELQEQYKNDVAPIYSDPNRNTIADGGLGNLGWWASNFPSFMSNLTMLIPGEGMAKGLSLLGKAKWINGKSIGNLTRSSVRALTGAIKNKEWKDLNAFQKFMNKDSTVKFVNAGLEVGVNAMTMRAIENYQEAQQTHKDTYVNSLSDLNEMTDEEYADFVNRNQDTLENVDFSDKTAVAKAIAKKAADETFKINWGNALFDVLQVATLRNMFRGGPNNLSSMSTRKMAREFKRWYGKTDAEKAALRAALPWKTKVKDFISDAAYGGKTVFLAEASEGLEEAWNYIAQEEGNHVAKSILKGDDGTTMTSRIFNDYLTAPELYDSAFWGVLGGILFHIGGSGFHHLSNKLTEKKEDVDTNSEYQWGEELETSENHRRIADLRYAEADLQGYQVLRRVIDDNKNPFNKRADGSYAEFADEVERENAKKRLWHETISKIALRSRDAGNLDLTKELFKSQELRSTFVESELANSQNPEADRSKIESDVNTDFDEAGQIIQHADDVYSQEWFNASNLANEYAHRNRDYDKPLEYLNIIARENASKQLQLERFDEYIDLTDEKMRREYESVKNSMNRGRSADNQVGIDEYYDNIKTIVIADRLGRLRAERIALSRNKNLQDTHSKELRLEQIQEQINQLESQLKPLELHWATAMSLRYIQNGDKLMQLDTKEFVDYENAIKTNDYSKIDRQIMDVSEAAIQSIANPGINLHRDYDNLKRRMNKLLTDKNKYNSSDFRVLANTKADMEVQRLGLESGLINTYEKFDYKNKVLDNVFNKARLDAITGAKEDLKTLYKTYGDIIDDLLDLKVDSNTYTQQRDAWRANAKQEDVAKFDNAVEILNLAEKHNLGLYGDLRREFKAIKENAAQGANSTQTSSTSQNQNTGQPNPKPINQSGQQQTQDTRQANGQNSNIPTPQPPQTGQSNIYLNIDDNTGEITQSSSPNNIQAVSTLNGDFEAVVLNNDQALLTNETLFNQDGVNFVNPDTDVVIDSNPVLSYDNNTKKFIVKEKGRLKEVAKGTAQPATTSSTGEQPATPEETPDVNVTQPTSGAVNLEGQTQQPATTEISEVAKDILDFEDRSLYPEVREYLNSGTWDGTISSISKKFSIGYNKATRMKKAWEAEQAATTPPASTPSGKAIVEIEVPTITGGKRKVNAEKVPYSELKKGDIVWYSGPESSTPINNIRVDGIEEGEVFGYSGGHDVILPNDRVYYREVAGVQTQPTPAPTVTPQQPSSELSREENEAIAENKVRNDVRGYLQSQITLQTENGDISLADYIKLEKKPKVLGSNFNDIDFGALEDAYNSNGINDFDTIWGQSVDDLAFSLELIGAPVGTDDLDASASNVVMNSTIADDSGVTKFTIDLQNAIDNLIETYAKAMGLEKHNGIYYINLENLARHINENTAHAHNAKTIIDILTKYSDNVGNISYKLVDKENAKTGRIYDNYKNPSNDDVDERLSQSKAQRVEILTLLESLGETESKVWNRVFESLEAGEELDYKVEGNKVVISKNGTVIGTMTKASFDGLYHQNVKGWNLSLDASGVDASSNVKDIFTTWLTTKGDKTIDAINDIAYKLAYDKLSAAERKNLVSQFWNLIKSDARFNKLIGKDIINTYVNSSEPIELYTSLIKYKENYGSKYRSKQNEIISKTLTAYFNNLRTSYQQVAALFSSDNIKIVVDRVNQSDIEFGNEFNNFTEVIVGGYDANMHKLGIGIDSSGNNVVSGEGIVYRSETDNGYTSVFIKTNAGRLYRVQAQPIKVKDAKGDIEAIREEFRNTLNRLFRERKLASDKEANFDEISKLLKLMFYNGENYHSLFGNIVVSENETGIFIGTSKTDGFWIYRHNQDGSAAMALSPIGSYAQEWNQSHPNEKYITYYDTTNTVKSTKDAVDSIIKIFDNAIFQVSKAHLKEDGVQDSSMDNSIARMKNGKFVVEINGKEVISRESYSDFMLANNYVKVRLREAKDNPGSNYRRTNTRQGANKALYIRLETSSPVEENVEGQLPEVLPSDMNDVKDDVVSVLDENATTSNVLNIVVPEIKNTALEDIFGNLPLIYDDTIPGYAQWRSDGQHRIIAISSRLFGLSRNEAGRQIIHELIHDKFAEKGRDKLKKLIPIYNEFIDILKTKDKAVQASLLRFLRIKDTNRDEEHLFTHFDAKTITDKELDDLEDFLDYSLMNRSLYDALNSFNTNIDNNTRKKSIFEKIIEFIQDVFGFGKVNDNSLLKKELNALNKVFGETTPRTPKPKQPVKKPAKKNPSVTHLELPFTDDTDEKLNETIKPEQKPIEEQSDDDLFGGATEFDVEDSTLSDGFTSSTRQLRENVPSESIENVNNAINNGDISISCK